MGDERYPKATEYARHRMASVAEVLTAYHDGNEDEVSPDEMILDFEVLGNLTRDKYIVTLLLGTGGPHDELRYAVPDGSVDHVTYWYADWGYGTEVPLTSDEAETATDFLEAIADLSILSEYIR